MAAHLDVMVIDNNIEQAKIIKLLNEIGYLSDYATERKIALDKIFKKKPKLVILDPMMPQLDGFRLLKAVRKNPTTSYTGFIIYSGKLVELRGPKAHALGIETCLIKPFELRELIVQVKNFFEIRKKLHEWFRVKVIGNTAEITKNYKNILFMENIIKTIENHLNDFQFGVNALSKEVHLSQSQLYRKIYGITKLSTTKFIQSVRLHHAVELLKNGSGSITEISFEVGFASHAYFSKCFREKFGCAPSQYVRKN